MAYAVTARLAIGKRVSPCSFHPGGLAQAAWERNACSPGGTELLFASSANTGARQGSIAPTASLPWESGVTLGPCEGRNGSVDQHEGASKRSWKKRLEAVKSLLGLPHPVGECLGSTQPLLKHTLGGPGSSARSLSFTWETLIGFSASGFGLAQP